MSYPLHVNPWVSLTILSMLLESTDVRSARKNKGLSVPLMVCFHGLTGFTKLQRPLLHTTRMYHEKQAFIATNQDNVTCWWTW